MASRERYCAICGDEMGLIDDRHYSRGDTCGKLTCEQAAREEERERREEAHRDLDDRMDW